MNNSRNPVRNAVDTLLTVEFDTTFWLQDTTFFASDGTRLQIVWLTVVWLTVVWLTVVWLTVVWPGAAHNIKKTGLASREPGRLLLR